MHPTQEDSTATQVAKNRNRNRRKPESGQSRPTIPDTVAGNWRAELLGGASLHLGGTVNQVPAPHAIEFSFMTLPACAYGPGKLALPAVIVLVAPAEQAERADVGTLTRDGPAAMIDLFVTRRLFPDLVPRIKGGTARW